MQRSPVQPTLPGPIPGAVPAGKTQTQAHWGGQNSLAVVSPTLPQLASLPFSGEFYFNWGALDNQKALLWPRSRRA